MSDINLARLVFSMAADTAQLQRDMASAKSSVGDAMDTIKSQVNTVKAAFGALAGALALNELVSMVTKVYDAGEKLHDLSIATGASVEALSALAAVGKTTGTSAETIGAAMNMMAKNTAIASEESKGAGAALRALGIDFGDFQQMSPDQKMLTVAQAMNQFEDGSGKAAVAMALMGRNGAQLLPYMKDLAEVGELQARMTSEQAAMSDNFNDNLVKLKSSGEAWKKELALGMLPALNDAVEATLGMTNGTGGLRAEVRRLSEDGSIESWTRTAIAGLTYVMDAGGGVVNVVKTIGQAVGMAIADVMALADGAAEAWEKVKNKDFSGALSSMGTAFAQVRANAASFGETFDQIWSDQSMGQKLRARLAETEAQNRAIRDAGGAAKEAKPNLDEFTNAGEGAGKAVKEAADEFAKLMEKLNAKESGVDSDFFKNLQILKEGLDGGRISLEDYIATVEKYINRQPFATAAAKEHADQVKAAQKAYDDYLAAQIKATQGVEATVEKEREAVATMGLSKEALGELQAAKYRDMAASLEREAAVRGEQGADEATVELLKRQAAAYREMADLKQAGGVKQAALDAAAEFKKTTDSINNTLTDALMRGFESGKSFAVVFRDTVVNMFKTMVLRPVISAIMSPISVGVAGLLGGSSAMAGGMGTSGSGSSAGDILGNMGALFGAGGLGGSMMAGAGWLTGATTLSGSLSAAGSLIATEGGLAAGLGMGIGALGPIALGALMLGQLFKSKGGPKQEGGYSLAGLNAVSDPAWAQLWSTSGGVSTMGESGTAKGMADSISAAYGQVARALGLANTALNVGLSYAMDPNGDSMTQLQVVTGNYNRGARLGGTENVARGEDALKAAVADETARVILAELQHNIKGSVGEALNRIDATRAAAGDINDLITGLEGVYKTLQDAAKATYALEPMGGVFGRIAALGIDAKNSLVEMAGGVDALIAKSQKFVDLYYSDTERGAISAKSILDATAGLGLGSIGGISTLADYRALVEAQNVGTEDGRRAVNTLLDLAPTFANIAKLLGGDSGLTLAALAGQAANTPAADFLRQLTAANGGDTGKTTSDLMQAWLDQSQRASDTLNGLIERLITVTAAAAESNNAILANIATTNASAATTASLALTEAA